ncbi:MAG: serine/threonine protein kinase [Synergistaceae bacterium]|nr:serine/threonine protein kinase [Candidatus Equadaptatus faecalis]
MAEFSQGDRIPVKQGGETKILCKLGEGGQGIVYRVEYQGKQYALKWYFAGKMKEPKQFYKNIESNIKIGAPSPVFLWPEFITEEYNGSFGYLMALRPSGYEEFGSFLLAKSHFKSLHAVVNAALSIVNGFRELHRKGLSYQDLNDGNFFINPENGDVLICDNDNVAPYGVNLGIAGKCRYMAPEVVTGKKVPDKHTDQFSLAVVLFMMLFLNHPLEGSGTSVACMSEEFERKFYGTDPVFIFDDSGANKPVQGVHRNAIKLWPVYPKFIQDAFKKSFSKEFMTGADSTHRILENEWQKLFVKLRDITVSCPHCGSGTFLDVNAAEPTCINCGKKMPKTFALKIKGGLIDNTVALYPHSKLYKCHTDSSNDNDYKEIVGEVLLGKSTPVKLGLKNLSGNSWTVELNDGSSVTLENGKTVVLGSGLKFKFNSSVNGEVILTN